MSNRLGGKQGTSYTGTNANQPPNWTFSNRNPTEFDINNVSLGDMWLNQDNESIWVLVSLAGDMSSKGSSATWSQLDSNISNDVQTLTGNLGGAVLPDINNNINIIGIGDIDVVGNLTANTLTVSLLVDPIEKITGNSGGAVSPDGSGNINIKGDGVGITITGNPGTNTLTASLIGSGDEAIQEIDGDTGTTVVPTVGLVNIVTGLSTVNSGSTISFNGATDTLTLNVTDGNDNTIIGKNSGNATLTASRNTSLGAASLSSLTSGNNNTAIGRNAGNIITSGTQNTMIGQASLSSLSTGSNNVAIGNLAGSAYNSNESSNISIGYLTAGSVGESNSLRIGVATGTGNGELNKSFIQGIYNISPSVANPRPVVIDSDGQIGTAQTAGLAFLATVNATIDDVTGDNTTYTVVFDTEIYDQGNNFASTTFTAPVTGKYNFSFGVTFKDLDASFTNGGVLLNTSNQVFLTNQFNYGAIQAGSRIALNGNICCDMDASDTTQFQVVVSGGTKTIDVIGSALSVNTYFGGILIQ